MLARSRIRAQVDELHATPEQAVRAAELTAEDAAWRAGRVKSEAGLYRINLLRVIDDDEAGPERAARRAADRAVRAMDELRWVDDSVAVHAKDGYTGAQLLVFAREAAAGLTVLTLSPDELAALVARHDGDRDPRGVAAPAVDVAAIRAGIRQRLEAAAGHRLDDPWYLAFERPAQGDGAHA